VELSHLDQEELDLANVHGQLQQKVYLISEEEYQVVLAHRKTVISKQERAELERLRALEKKVREAVK
jgi:hypothetical protein